MSTASTLILHSSNIRLKYFEDCLRALAVPRGTVLHFRYLAKYVEPTLLDDIRRGQALHRRVLVCYLHQRPKEGGGWKPDTSVPLREGRIVEAHAVGTEIHLYFSASGYPSAQRMDYIRGVAAGALSSSTSVYVASRSEALADADFSTAAKDDEAFTAVVDAIPQEICSVLADDRTTLIPFDPLFVRIQGVYTTDKRMKAFPIEPKPIATYSERRHVYLVDSDEPLELRVQFHQPRWSTFDTAGASLVLTSDQDHFANPDEDRLDIASLYDETSFYLLPIRNAAGWLSRVVLAPTIEANQPTSHGRRLAPSFSLIFKTTPIYPRWLTLAANAATNSVAIILALVSTIIAVGLKNTAKDASVASGVVGAAIVIIGLVLAITIVAAIVRSRTGTSG